MPWEKPKASSGKKVPRAVLAQTMGIELETYNMILEVARRILASDQVIVQTKRWNLVPSSLKQDYQSKLRVEVESLFGSTEFAEIQRRQSLEILRQSTVVDHFLLCAYQTLRNSFRVRDVNVSVEDTSMAVVGGGGENGDHESSAPSSQRQEN